MNNSAFDSFDLDTVAGEAAPPTSAAFRCVFTSRPENMLPIAKRNVGVEAPGPPLDIICGNCGFVVGGLP